MRCLIILIIIVTLAACSAGSVNYNKTQTAGHIEEGSLDSIIQFLITSAATDFHAHKPYPASFRNVHIGHITSNGIVLFMLCGEFLRVQDGGNTEWMPFATIKTSGYEQWVGSQALAYCQSRSFILEKNEDFSSMLQNRLDSLK